MIYFTSWLVFSFEKTLYNMLYSKIYRPITQSQGPDLLRAVKIKVCCPVKIKKVSAKDFFYWLNRKYLPGNNFLKSQISTDISALALYRSTNNVKVTKQQFERMQNVFFYYFKQVGSVILLFICSYEITCICVYKHLEKQTKKM